MKSPGLIAILCLFIGCNVTGPSEFIPEYVVEAYLFSNEPLPEVRLSRTVPAGTAYIFEDQAVSQAAVVIRRLDETGAVAREFSYVEQAKGVYIPGLQSEIVRPLARYELEVAIPDEETVLRSVTLVPDSFRIVGSTADTVEFLSAEQLEVTVTRSEFPGRQNVYIFSTEAFDVRFENLTPFFQDIFDEEEDDLEEFRVNESPPVNEGNFEVNPDGTVTVKLPWIAVNFFGRNRISIYVVDDNILNFIITHDLQVNPSTLSPGELPDVIDPIEGGRGIFGSFARVSKEIYIARPGEFSP